MSQPYYTQHVQARDVQDNMAKHTAKRSKKKNVTCTVFLILCEGPGYSGEYRSVRKSELMSVDFPRPDSPERQRRRGWSNTLTVEHTEDE